MSKVLHLKIPMGEEADRFLVSEAIVDEFVNKIKAVVGDEYKIIASPFAAEMIDNVISM